MDKLNNTNSNNAALLKKENLAQAFELFTQFPKDFFCEGREDLPPQVREIFNSKD